MTSKQRDNERNNWGNKRNNRGKQAGFNKRVKQAGFLDVELMT
jgi:hypothetical protein